MSARLGRLLSQYLTVSRCVLPLQKKQKKPYPALRRIGHLANITIPQMTDASNGLFGVYWSCPRSLDGMTDLFLLPAGAGAPAWSIDSPGWPLRASTGCEQLESHKEASS